MSCPDLLVASTSLQQLNKDRITPTGICTISQPATRTKFTANKRYRHSTTNGITITTIRTTKRWDIRCEQTTEFRLQSCASGKTTCHGMCCFMIRHLNLHIRQAQQAIRCMVQYYDTNPGSCADMHKPQAKTAWDTIGRYLQNPEAICKLQHIIAATNTTLTEHTGSLWGVSWTR